MSAIAPPMTPMRGTNTACKTIFSAAASSIAQAARLAFPSPVREEARVSVPATASDVNAVARMRERRSARSPSARAG